MKPLRIPLLVVVLAACLCGCATPPEALQQGQHTGALIGGLQDSLGAFNRHQQRLATLTLDSIAEQEAAIGASRRSLDVLAAVSREVGDTSRAATARQLTAVADALAVAAAPDNGAQLRAVALQERLQAPAARDLAAAQQAALAMGMELHRQDRVRAAIAFVQTVRAGVQANDEDMRKSDEVAQAGAIAGDVITDKEK